MEFLKIDTKGGQVNASAEAEPPITKEKLKEQFPAVFTGKTGHLNKYQLDGHASKDCKPVVRRESRLPLGRGEVLEGKLHGPTTWVSLPTAFPKRDKRWRMVIDMIAVNEALQREINPIPKKEEMLCKVSPDSCFTNLDLQSFQLQFGLKEEVRHLTTFITHTDMFRFKRLAFGLSVAAEKCQKVMEELGRDLFATLSQDAKGKVGQALKPFQKPS